MGRDYVMLPQQMCTTCQTEDPLKAMQDHHRAGVVRLTTRGNDA